MDGPRDCHTKEIVILSEVRNRQTSYDTVYVESKKGATNELIYKT